MARKNKRIKYDLWLTPIKDENEWRPQPRCDKFPTKTVFTTGYRAQEAIDEIASQSSQGRIPKRVYDCSIDDGGCGYFHITSQDEYVERYNA